MPRAPAAHASRYGGSGWRQAPAPPGYRQRLVRTASSRARPAMPRVLPLGSDVVLLERSNVFSVPSVMQAVRHDEANDEAADAESGGASRPSSPSRSCQGKRCGPRHGYYLASLVSVAAPNSAARVSLNRNPASHTAASKRSALSHGCTLASIGVLRLVRRTFASRRRPPRRTASRPATPRPPQP